MPIELQATYRSFSPPIRANKRIRARLAALERLRADIKSCALTAEQSHDHQLRGTTHRVAIAVTLAEGKTVADHEHHNEQAHEDFYVALDNAFDALERMLKSHVGVPVDSAI